MGILSAFVTISYLRFYGTWLLATSGGYEIPIHALPSSAYRFTPPEAEPHFPNTVRPCILYSITRGS